MKSNAVCTVIVTSLFPNKRVIILDNNCNFSADLPSSSATNSSIMIPCYMVVGQNLLSKFSSKVSNLISAVDVCVCVCSILVQFSIIHYENTLTKFNLNQKYLLFKKETKHFIYKIQIESLFCKENTSMIFFNCIYFKDNLLDFK